MPKNIILCSDGTGNKGGYDRDTNVYKLYKSVALHNPEHPQISYYDNGIGAEENQHKYLQKLASAFGFGFQGNICDLYEFLARNYDPGDAIFIFGFSRGGATVRALTGLLYTCGLVNRKDSQGLLKSSDILKADIVEAVKAYEQIDTNRQVANDFKAGKALHDEHHVPNGALPIQLIGVWDTVSALGFPKDWSITFDWFFSMMDRVSDRFWPHRFYDYELNSTIKHAYQVLSIDDERKTFFPMIWDESANDFSGDVEQVWFSGIHKNVGGGAARTGLADITMEWMLTRATQQGMVLKEGVLEHFRADADIYDHMYGSREGFAVYFRYAPRDLAALCQTKDGQSLLTGSIKVHNTVIQRIRQGTGAYAPGFLPFQFDVVATPLQEAVVPVQAAKEVSEWNACREQMDKLVGQRQVIYRIFVEFTLFVLLMSGWLWMNPGVTIIEDPDSLNIIERFFGHIADVFEYILPAFFENIIHYVIRIHSWIFVAVVIFTVALIKWRTSLQNNLKRANKQICQMLLSQNESV